ncbi:SusC/RagA family TonB-linked outer membrane protein [Polaribacter cellanae]|uniref:SusC/RagA family TonB-linked outer membrane protein n=1 Tax=Polaribacter cellanae TaxID=2818493 RepID=A0A975H883_9FLAO|nr:SusC/RagA family TonB-linked outer membrane protein [Polaribacter cellanae]QTE21330.1 SusC/RagA family TonB-linked outer membrane protein [Polaribacter cellanae]
MEKKRTIKMSGFLSKYTKNLLLIMKRCLILSMLFFSVTAFSYSQKVTLELGEVKLSKALKSLKKLTKVDFFYSDNELNVNRMVVANYKEIDLITAVSKLVGINYKVEKTNDNIVLITPVTILNFKKNIIVKGTVTNTNGDVLPGATVMIKGTKNGTMTDFNGNYSIETDKKATLIFSYIGYLSQEIKVDGKTQINVKLVESASKLDEIVITGVVKRKKESFTGAITTVKGKELKTIGNLNVIESLKTIDPSFVIYENNILGSNPNRLPNIEVRGKTSVSTDNLRDEFGANPNQPLFILDGFESTLRTIIDLDMNRVASITILKDASSTALYGARAANGVIVVETIKPVAGKLQVIYNSDLRVEMPDLTDYNLMNSTQKLKYEKLSGLWNAPSYDIGKQFELDKQYNKTLAEIKRGVNTYWLNEPVRVGTTTSHSLNISGGNKEITFGVGLNYKDLNGVMIGSNRKTWGTNFNLRYRKDKLNVSNNLYINGYDANESPYGSFSNFVTANPYFRKTDTNGNPTKYLDIDGYFRNTITNPLYNATLNTKNNSSNLQITNNLQAILTLSEKFRIQSNFQINKETTILDTFLPPEHTNFIGTDILERGKYTNQKSDRFSYRLNVMASYATVVKDKHSITANLRAEAEETNNNRLGVSAVGFPTGTNGNPAFAFGYQPNSKPVSVNSKFRRINMLASVNYVLDRTYLFDATYRIDGSTVFGSNKKFSPFWAIGAGINLHKAFEMDNHKVSMLKLRGNIGSTGNQGFGNLSSVSIYEFTKDINIFGQGTDLLTLANPNLQWQKTLNTSIGLDAVLFNNRVNATLNAFQKKTDPLVVRIDLPSSTGVFNYPINTGFMNTKGVEAIIRVSPIYKPQEQIVWTLGFTASAVKSVYGGFNNTLKSLNDKAQVSQSLLRYKDGYSPDDLWAVESLGIDPASGKEVFLNSDDSPTYEYNSKNIKVMGNSRPDLEGVISSNLRLKNFTFGVNLRYRFGGDVLNTALFNKVENISLRQRINNQDLRALTDRWIKPGDISSFKSIAQFGSTPISSRFIQEENVIIGESINFGYEFREQQWIKHIGLNRLRLNGYMNEIFRISSIRTERGIDYPFARAISFSINAYF